MESNSPFLSQLTDLDCVSIPINPGAILDQIIAQGYEVSAISSLLFDRAHAEEFLKVLAFKIDFIAPFGVIIILGIVLMRTCVTEWYCSSFSL